MENEGMGEAAAGCFFFFCRTLDVSFEGEKK